jgi:hypothetical protein
MNDKAGGIYIGHYAVMPWEALFPLQVGQTQQSQRVRNETFACRITVIFLLPHADLLRVGKQTQSSVQSRGG